MRKLGIVWVLITAVLFTGCVPSKTVSGENSVAKIQKRCAARPFGRAAS